MRDRSRLSAQHGPMTQQHLSISVVAIAMLMAWGASSAAHARAQDVSWRAPAACPSPEEAEARLRAVVRAADTSEHVTVSVHAEVHATVADGHPLYHLVHRVEDDGAPSVREVSDPDCAGILEAAVLFTALALDVPLEEVARPPLAPASEPRAPDPPAAVIPWLQASIELSSAVLPRIRPGVALEAGLRRGRLLASLGLTALAPEAASSSSGPRVAVRAMFGTLRGCGQWGRSRWTFVPCMAAEIGRVRGRGMGTDADRKARSLYAALAFDLGVNVHIAGRLTLIGALRGRALLARPRFFVEGFGELFRTPSASIGGTLGLRVDLL